jgi:ring-1,2-phenylacetyl-CoA epoxidase subunit PaaB
MSIQSLDPRVVRLPRVGAEGRPEPKQDLDQLGTFEVFVEPKDGKPYQHEGAVHASDVEMAFVLAKEAFTRRFTCTAMAIADTRSVTVSPTTEGAGNAYDLIPDEAGAEGLREPYEIFHLLRRGKQHVHAGTVEAGSPASALSLAKKRLRGDKQVFNVWAIRRRDMRFSTPEEREIWKTLPDKKFRDASDYKGGDKLKSFLERWGQQKSN